MSIPGGGSVWIVGQALGLRRPLGPPVLLETSDLQQFWNVNDSIDAIHKILKAPCEAAAGRVPLRQLLSSAAMMGPTDESPP
jgi:hypothetical protein